MAQVGDTITYTYNGGTSPDEVRQSEDISDIGEITIEYIDTAGGEVTSGGSTYGGRVESVDVDVSGEDTLYIWVSTQPEGRYYGGSSSYSGFGGGSAEVAFISTDQADSDDEPFIAGAGGGGGGFSTGYYGDVGNGGARGGSGADNGVGTPPPQGGDGAPQDGSGTAGDGAIANRAEILDAGTTIKGGGSAPDADGEVKITYKSGAPSAPSNVAITDAQTEGELTVDWDTVSGASGYYVYRAESSGSAKADYTQVADVTSPPYVDQNLEDGERYYYRVSAYN